MVTRAKVVKVQDFSLFSAETTGIYLLKPSGYYVYCQLLCVLPVTVCTASFNITKSTFCSQGIYVVRISELCPVENSIIASYKRDNKCLLRGTNWIFI